MHTKKSLLWYGVSIALALGIGLWLLDRVYPPDLQRYLDRSVLVLARDGRLLRGFTSSDDAWRLELTPSEVEPLFLEMLLGYEDRRFFSHPGVDPIALLRAFGQWAKHGRVVSGASTLTMQAVRLLQPRPRTLYNKAVEMLRALQLEMHLGKQEILAIYLTLAPYGGNLEGLRAASLAYLGKEPGHLTPAEAALLVVLPQAPSRLRPDRQSPTSETLRHARDKVLRRLLEIGVLTVRQAREAIQEPIPNQRRRLPFHAPHLARRLVRTAPRRRIHHTTLDYALQETLEHLLHTRLQSAPLADAHSGSALLVVDNRGPEVIAYLGSGDFFDAARRGQVDMIRALRSPGSTLKPLIYGMGFDDLRIHPQTLIADVPTRFGNYTPSNFLNVYHGEVSIVEALKRSLNIPAVAVLEAVGPGRLQARLEQAGIPLVFGGYSGAGPAGLPLALGGVGTTLEGLVTLYTALANGGRARPLVYSRDLATGATAHTGESKSTVILGPAANWQVVDILTRTPPPKGLLAAGYARNPRAIAYKTGTSYGFRDAWAIGFDRDYTVGVWTGRPDGTPRPGHYGRRSAAPLLFEVFDLLPAPAEPWPGPPPPEVLQVVNQDLPPPLRRFRRDVGDQWRQQQHQSGPLRILFPPDDATIPATGEVPRRLPLVAGGGKTPLRWLINGHPVPASRRYRKTFWDVDGSGFVEITVIDADGQSAHSEVRLE